MRLTSSPTSAARRALRFLALPLFLGIVALAVPGAFSGSAATAQANSDFSPAHKKTHPAGKTRKSAKEIETHHAHRSDPAGKKTKKSRRHVHRASRAARRARTARIKLAFVASAELRPMAQQLATLRTPAAYAGVTRYAQGHTGEAAAAAYLALGHAYLLDKRYAEAVASFRLARQDGAALADFADFLAARADQAAGDNAAAEALLHGFAQRYPDSIFVDQAPELEASSLLALKDVAGARQVLVAAEQTDAAVRPGYQLIEAEVAAALGQTDEAVRIYKQLLLNHPLGPEAGVALASLNDLGAILTTTELRSLGDAYYNAGRYEEASEQYRALLRQTSIAAKSRATFAVDAAACDLKLHRLTMSEAQSLADTPDENGARRDYLLIELARDRDDLDAQKTIVAEMETRFPGSPWLAKALFDSGNIYLLRREYPTAIAYYSTLAKLFPQSRHAAAAHWRAAWLTYRIGNYAEAARLCDEQIRLYPSADESVAALYWRGRLYETFDHQPAQAAAHYRAIVRADQHYFYAQMARQRLTAMGGLLSGALPELQPQLYRFQPPPAPALMQSFPADSPHLAKARLLANAGLNEYIAQEIAADPDSASWSALAEAQIYASYGETFRALRAVKRALPSAASSSIQSIPLAYWRILFPEPYWQTILAESAKNGLDPYLVLSLIRQESEFNPSAVSAANAYGLMQMLPSVGRSMAREEGMHHFHTYQLLDPETNIRLGTRYLRRQLDQFGGGTEYALAAYNAGDSRVAEWKADGPYSGMDEFVESIPFHETRGYVESILRNIEIYREIDTAARTRSDQ